VPPEICSEFDAVIHLSGESVAGLWTASKKQRIRDSRIITSGHLSQALAKAERKPAIFLGASAIGYYGNRGDELLTEKSPPGDGFLSEVCREWESATGPASKAGIPTIHLRTGIVLSRDGGALKPMLLPFRLGLGGRLGHGRQWWNWIHIQDYVAAIQHILQIQRATAAPFLNGPVNLVSPNPVTNVEFTATLADTLERPALLPVPAFALKLVFGEFAEEGMLASARVVPEKLLASGFRFRYPDLKLALAELLAGAAQTS
jgi:uncharacterized protein (TIGR01777 family)